MKKITRSVLVILFWLIFVLSFLWCELALAIDSPSPRLWGVVFLILTALTVFVTRNRIHTAVLYGVLFGAFFSWWLSIEPRNDRPWLPDVAQLPSIEIVGSQLTVHNLRNFEYRSDTDFTPHWETRTYDLSKLIGVDVFTSDWGATGIVHTIVSWDFGGNDHLAVSIETRKEVGEEYSTVRGFFRQFELYYVVADERDVIGIRTNYRGERVKLYRITMKPAAVRAVLASYVKHINALVTKPRWYNALTSNCTTAIRMNVQSAGIQNPLDWRLIANGYADELLYERGQVNTTIPFEELRRLSDITKKAQSVKPGENFSEKIREGLPARM